MHRAKRLPTYIEEADKSLPGSSDPAGNRASNPGSPGSGPACVTTGWAPLLTRPWVTALAPARWYPALVPFCQNPNSQLLPWGCPAVSSPLPDHRQRVPTSDHPPSDLRILLPGGQIFTPATSHLSNGERGRRGRDAAGAAQVGLSG